MGTKYFVGTADVVDLSLKQEDHEVFPISIQSSPVDDVANNTSASFIDTGLTVTLTVVAGRPLYIGFVAHTTLDASGRCGVFNILAGAVTSRMEFQILETSTIIALWSSNWAQGGVGVEYEIPCSAYTHLHVPGSSASTTYKLQARQQGAVGWRTENVKMYAYQIL